MSAASEQFLIALDIGATRTKALFGTLKGDTLATSDGTGMNLRTVSKEVFDEEFRSILKGFDASRRFNKGFPGVIAVGAAGAGGEQEKQRLKTWIKELGFECPILVEHDAFIAHYGAFEGETGVIVTAGTGSIAYGRTSDGREARAGGLGWLLGDEGSGYWIGREALRAILQHFSDEQDSPLWSLLRKKWQLKNRQGILQKVYHPDFDPKEIAELAMLVTESAEQGDSLAVDILHRAGHELASIGVEVAEKLAIPASELELAFLGSVWNGAKKYLKPAVEKVIDMYNRKGTLVNKQLEGDKHNTVIDHMIDKSKTLSTRPDFPEFPPLHIRIGSGQFPRIIKPREDALHGAARWARDYLLKRRFA